MKYFTRYATALLGTLLLVSCGGGSGSANPEDISESDASSIIGYYNVALEVFDDGPDAEDYDDVIAYMKSKGTSEYMAPHFSEVMIFSDSSEMRTPGAGFSKAQRDSLVTAWNVYFASHNQFSKNYAEFKAYKQAEDYRDDNWAKGVSLGVVNDTLFKQMNNARRQVFSIIEPLADAAEMATMGDNPLKDHILLSKEIFGEMEYMLDLVAEDKVNAPALDSAYTHLESLVSKGRGLPSVPENESDMRWYAEYLDNVDLFLGVVRKASRDRRYTSSVWNDMDSKHSSAISDYNTFIN